MQENKPPATSALAWSEEWDLPVQSMDVNLDEGAREGDETIEFTNTRNERVREDILAIVKGCEKLPVSAVPGIV